MILRTADQHDGPGWPGDCVRNTQYSGRRPRSSGGADDEPMAELRAARVADVDAVVSIDPVGPGRLEAIRDLVLGNASLVGVERGQVAGFLALRPGHFYDRDFIELLFVAPAWQRRGLGRALLRAALLSASTSRVFTSANESNTPMRELLRSEGWIPSGVLTGLDEGDPEHVFFCDVPSAASG
jgi:GNAT superfamily N-acetyltransferase